MRTLKLTLAYDGTDFAGWQVQPGRRTVQQTLEDVLTKIAGHPVKVVASGRTDAAVHALAQVVSFQTSSELPADIWLRAINAELHRDLAALKVDEATPGFNARRDAKRKQYRYVLQDGRIRDAFSRNYVWHCFRQLDAEAMHRAAQPLVGKHDFRSFQTAGSRRKTTVRTVFDLTAERLAGQGVGRGARSVPQSTATAGRDSHRNHRRRVLVQHGAQHCGDAGGCRPRKQTESWPAEVLAARDRRAAAPTAPPQGLFLVVEYD